MTDVQTKVPHPNSYYATDGNVLLLCYVQTLGYISAVSIPAIWLKQMPSIIKSDGITYRCEYVKVRARDIVLYNDLKKDYPFVPKHLIPLPPKPNHLKLIK